MPIKLEPLPPQEAINFFEQLGLVLTERWDELWTEMHAKSFTVVGVMRLDVLTDIYEQIKKAINKGTTLDEFKKDFKKIIKRRGWYDPKFTPWRLETIFRTNIQTAYQAGRYKQMAEMADVRPYWMYDAVNDNRTRPAHRAMDGKVFRADDPIWDSWYPPNGFNCRCRVVALSEHQLKRKGLKVEKGKSVNVKPDMGFEYNPGKVTFELDIKKYRKKYKDLFKVNPKILKPPQKIPGAISKLKDFLNERLNLNIQEIKAVGKRNYFMACTHGNEIRISSSTFYSCNNFCPSKDLKNALKKMEKGEPLAFNEEYSLESLWHEILHSCQSKRELSLLPDIDKLVMETFHQWRARLTYGELLQAFGYTPRFATKTLNEGYGYSLPLKKTRWFFNRLKIDAGSLLNLSERNTLIKLLDVENYIIEKLDIISMTNKEEFYKKKLQIRNMVYDATSWYVSEERFQERWEPFIKELLRSQNER